MEFRITNDGNEADTAEIYKMLKDYNLSNRENSSKQLKKRQSSEAVNMSLLIHFLSKHLGFTQSWAIKKYSRYKNILTPEPDITTRKNYKFQAY